MTALFLPAPGFVVGSSVSLYLTVFILLVAGCVYAPTAVKRDKRVLVSVVFFLLAVVIGAPARAAATRVCDYAWWAFECWFR